MSLKALQKRVERIADTLRKESDDGLVEFEVYLEGEMPDGVEPDFTISLVAGPIIDEGEDDDE